MNQYVIATVGDHNVDCGGELKGSIVKEDRAVDG